MSGFNVTVGFSTTNKLLSRLIRWVTGGKVSHAWVGFTDSALEVEFVMQAEWWGFELRPRTRWLEENILVEEFVLTGPDASGAVKWMVKEYVGTRYDYKAALLVGLKWLGKWIKGRFRNPKKLMCSEGVVRMLCKAGYNSGLVSENPEFVSPAELREYCRRQELMKTLGAD